MKPIMAMIMAALMIASPLALSGAMTQETGTVPVPTTIAETDQPLVAQESGRDRSFIHRLHLVGVGRYFPALDPLAEVDSDADRMKIHIAVGRVNVVDDAGTEREHRVGVIRVADSATDEKYKYRLAEVDADEDTGEIDFEIYTIPDKTLIGSGSFTPEDRETLAGHTRTVFVGSLTFDDPDGLDTGEGKAMVVTPRFGGLKASDLARIRAEEPREDSNDKKEIAWSAKHALTDLRARHLLAQHADANADLVSKHLAGAPDARLRTALAVIPTTAAQKVIDSGEVKRDRLTSAIAGVKARAGKLTDLATSVRQLPVAPSRDAGTTDDLATDPADFDEDGDVDRNDLDALIANWGPCVHADCPWDLNSDGGVNTPDLAHVLASWTHTDDPPAIESHGEDGDADQPPVLAADTAGSVSA